MASKDTGLEITGNSSKMDDEIGDGKSGSELKTTETDRAIIDLDASGNSDLNRSDCLIIDIDEPGDSNDTSSADKQSATDIVETNTDLVSKSVLDTRAAPLAIELAEKSATIDAGAAIESIASENTPAKLGMNAGSSGEYENADSSVFAENEMDSAVNEMESDALKGVDEMDFVSATASNQEIESTKRSIDCEQTTEAERPKDIDCTKVADQSDSMASLLTSNKSAIDESIEIDDDDECISSLVESFILLDTPEKDVQSIVTVSDSGIDDKSTERGAGLGTPMKIAGDISIIDISTPPEKFDSNVVDNEPISVAVPKTSAENAESTESGEPNDKKSLRFELDAPKTVEIADLNVDGSESVSVDENQRTIDSIKSLENVKSTEAHVNKSLAPDTVEISEQLAHVTENIEGGQQPLEMLIAADEAADTISTETEKSNEKNEKNSSKDDNVVESDLKIPETDAFANNDDEIPEVNVDLSSAGEKIILSTEDSNSADPTAPAIELIVAEKCDASAEVNENVQDATSLNVEADELINDNNESAAGEETDKVHEPPAAIATETNEKLAEMDESMETNDAIVAPTEAEAPMDIDEINTNETDAEMPDAIENKMDCEQINDNEANEENAEELDKIDANNAEPLDGEAQPDSTTAADEPTELSTSNEKEEKTPERSQFIRVKSMAFLFSDATDDSNDNDTTKPSSGADIEGTKVDRLKAAADDLTTTETMNIEQLEKTEKVKTKRNTLLANVLKNVLGNTGLISAEQTDSDSEVHSPLTEPASPTVDAQKESEVTPTPKPTAKRPSLPEVKECLNIECSHKSRDYFEAPEFVISHFHVTKKRKTIYVCDECFEGAIAKYGELCGALEYKQPLYMEDIPKRTEFVEILDSSDEEDSAEGSLEKGKNEDECASTPTSTFKSEALAMIECELENVITASLQRININQQMDWNRQILDQKLNRQMNASLAILDDLKQLQRTADQIYKDTYKGINCFVEEISSYDSDTHAPFQLSDATYPPSGEFQHEKELDTTTMYYTLRKNLISAWTPCCFLEKVVNPGSNDMMKIQLLRPGKNKATMCRVVSRKHMAYGKAPPNRLDVGTRCIALFKLSNQTKHATFYPGIIAEPLREYNKWRYLVFFDDGYAQYVVHDDVRVVCEASANVWEDVVAESREFIETYLHQFSKMRPMVQVQRGQRMMTEWGGKWINAIVIAVDASLVQMYFEDDKRYEWIYRGSTRLGPLYRQNKQQKKSKNALKVVNLIDKGDKVDDKTNASDVTEHSTSSSEAPPIQRTFPAQATRDTPQKQREKREQAEQQEKEKRAVAKKSSSLPPRPTVQHLNNSTIYVDEDNKPKGKVIYYTAKRHLPPRKYTTHECSPACLFQITHNLSTYSPLSKPLLSGWERQICKAKGKKSVVYKAPCGRRLRNMSELHRYLRMTKCSLNVENFDYDFMIHCLAEYVIDTSIINKPDISEGVENMLVPCVNYYDTTMPPPCVYSAKRIPTEGVHLNLDSSFMCGCDCTDDCLDKTKCQCWQLTIAGAKYGNPYTPEEEIGYVYKRLPEQVNTGIYECNSNCKCQSNCLNRVAQQPLQMKLQVFKTGNRGWGLRCLNDVPKGSFICCYAGNLLTEQVANEAGTNLGDEYFAELDYIEVVEAVKEGYEPEVMNDDDKSSEDSFDPDAEPANKDDSDDDFVSKAYISERRMKTRYRTRNSIDTKKKEEKKKEEEKKRDADESSDDERQPISFMPAQKPQEEPTTAKSIRKFFGKNEAVYIMDAKKTGNIGRYFNHSCTPNLFVQNVFVDTHDLRFPWVAFFASSHIRAGTELTWNYNYDVGSVPGKVLFCQCGADTCRGRLL